MSEVIKLKEEILKRRNPNGQDLTSLLKKAALLRKHMPDTSQGIYITGFKSIKKFFESKMSDVLIKWHCIDSDFFLCGNYISGLLSDITETVPESWFAIDYILKDQETNNPYIIKNGANICFLICTIFKGRSELRTMRYNDYERMGIGLFAQFYSRTGAEIGYHMSRQYKTMVKVTEECMRTI